MSGGLTFANLSGKVRQKHEDLRGFQNLGGLMFGGLTFANLSGKVRQTHEDLRGFQNLGGLTFGGLTFANPVQQSSSFPGNQSLDFTLGNSFILVCGRKSADVNSSMN